MNGHDPHRTLVQLRARTTANGAPVVFPDLRARRSAWWRSPLARALGYPFCAVLGAVAVLVGRW